MNRREFVQGSTVLAAWAAVAGTGPAATAAEQTSRAERRCKLALTPGSIGVTVQSQRELNEIAQRHGFEAVEPRPAEIAAMTPEQIAETQADLGAKKLVWAAAGSPVDFRKDEATFRAGLAELPKIAAGLRRAGVQRVGTWLGPSSDELTYRANFRQHVARLGEVARVLRDHELRLGLEYVGTQLLLVGKRYPFVHTLAETRELIAEIGTGNVGLVLDTWHWWTAGDTVADLLTLKNAEVVSVDLNDAPAGVLKAQRKDNARELPAATGVIEVAAFLGALVTLGYDGPVRAEPFNAALNALENEPACAAAARRRAVGLIGG
ncbi:MAG: sugar phosphate isomerase/epimerase [Undibacterium sp.]|nr:sugar phosphate isomerase/epimerase [Opitutaceae bacterium]